MDCFVASLLAMTSLECQPRIRILAARAPELCLKTSPGKTEGAGNAGCPLHPQPRLVWHTSLHHRSTGNTRHSLRNGFNGLFRALPGDEFVLSPSSVD